MLLWVSERMLWVAPGVSAVCGHGHSVVAQRRTARRERRDDVFRGALAGDVWRANTASQNADKTKCRTEPQATKALPHEKLAASSPRKYW